MIQIILMIIGLVYFVKLLTLGSQSAAKLGWDATAFEEWKQLKRHECNWMIAAGWGSFVLSLVVAFTGGVILAIVFPQDAGQSAECAVTLVNFAISVIVMLLCYNKATKFGKQAKALVAQGSSQAPQTTITG